MKQANVKIITHRADLMILVPALIKVILDSNWARIVSTLVYGVCITFAHPYIGERMSKKSKKSKISTAVALGCTKT